MTTIPYSTDASYYSPGLLIWWVVLSHIHTQTLMHSLKRFVLLQRSLLEAMKKEKVAIIHTATDDDYFDQFLVNQFDGIQYVDDSTGHRISKEKRYSMKRRARDIKTQVSTEEEEAAAEAAAAALLAELDEEDAAVRRKSMKKQKMKEKKKEIIKKRMKAKKSSVAKSSTTKDSDDDFSSDGEINFEQYYLAQ